MAGNNKTNKPVVPKTQNLKDSGKEGDAENTNADNVTELESAGAEIKPKTVSDPHTKELVKPGKLKVYKTLYGSMKLPVWTKDRRGDDVKTYVHFKDNTFVTSDEGTIAAIEVIMKTEADAGMTLKARKVLTEEEFFSIVSPEKLYVEYNGKQLHINTVRAGLQIAEENGWVAKEDEMIHLNLRSGKVRKGAISAASEN